MPPAGEGLEVDVEEEDVVVVESVMADRGFRAGLGRAGLGKAAAGFEDEEVEEDVLDFLELFFVSSVSEWELEAWEGM